MARALITIGEDADRERAHKWVKQAPVGTRLEFKAPKRSLPQNDLMWSRLTELAIGLDWYGQKLTPDDWKDIFTSALRKARVVPGIDPGSFVILGLHTSDLSKDEMTNLLDLMDAFAAERGIIFRDTK